MTDLIGSSNPAAGPGTRVTLHFSLLFPNGEEIDTTRNGDPATFEWGDGSLLPGFESAIAGQRAGFAEQIELAPADAFGERNPANVQTLPRERFRSMGEPLEPGLMVSFQAPDGELPGVVEAVYEGGVKVDFNHPLAGRKIIFDVAIIRVEPLETDA